MKTYYENGHKIIQVTQGELGPMTEEEKTKAREATKYPIIIDEDCPEITDEQFANMMTLKEFNRLERQKSVLSIRVKKKTIYELRKLGKGYTAIAARILEKALQDPEFLKKCL